MFTPELGDRFDVPNFAILLSDGQPTVEMAQTIPQAIAVRMSKLLKEKENA